MDTPKKTTQIGTPISKSKFEDSPVFSYINSLSPIKPVKSISIAQTFSSLSFASPPSVFTSPHINSHKESRFFARQSSSDPSKPGGLPRDGCTAVEEVDAAENFDADASIAEDISIEPPSDNFEMELPQILKYDCSTPGHDTVSCATETNNNMSLVPFAPQGDNGSPEVIGMNLQKMCNQGKNETPDWESLISDSTELLTFSSPNDSEAFGGLIQRTSDSGARLCSDAMPTLQADTTSFKNNESEPSATHPCEALSNLHRGTKRRCLDFEVAGTRTKHTKSSNNSPRCDSSFRYVLPSIGLHLNAIAMSSKDMSKTSIIHETSFLGKIQISLPVSNVPIHSPKTCQAETEICEDMDQDVEDVSKASAGEELISSSPKKKRRKFEQAGEVGESCKRCNCKKSKCLKLYCECFAAGVYCIEPCSCVDCFNKPIHEDTVLATRKQIESRNPLAFAPKVIRSSEPTFEAGDDSSKTPASARHKRGCNCKKSNCLKKYCECYQGGVGCSINCRCEGCKNAFGRKDGSSLAGTEGEQEEENETSEKTGTAKALKNTDLMNEEEQNPGSDSGLPSTPLPLYIQPLAQMPFSSIVGATGSSSSSSSSSSRLFNGHTFRKPDIVSTQSTFDKSFEVITEEMTPEILIRSPMATVTTVSPNRKRVSPPHLNSPGSVLGKRSGGRKLVLKSIPSFPSLTPEHRVSET